MKNKILRISAVSNGLVSLILIMSAFVAHAGPVVPDSIANDIDTGYAQRALIQLRPLLQQFPHDREVQYRYGEALVVSNKLEEAQMAMKAAIAVDPDASVLHRVLGEAYGSAAQQASLFSMYSLAKSSLAEFQKAVKLDPNDPDAHADLASYYIQAPGIAGGSLDKAHEEEALLDKLSPVQALQTRASEAEQKKDWASAERLLRQAIAIDKKPDSLVQLAMMQGHAERPGDAYVTLKLISARPDAPATSWYYLGRSSAAAHREFNVGIAAMKHYIELAERPDTAPKVFWAHLRLGELYALNQQKDLASTEVDLARKQAPTGDSNFESALDKVVALLK